MTNDIFVFRRLSSMHRASPHYKMNSVFAFIVFFFFFTFVAVLTDKNRYAKVIYQDEYFKIEENFRWLFPKRKGHVISCFNKSTPLPLLSINKSFERRELNFLFIIDCTLLPAESIVVNILKKLNVTVQQIIFNNVELVRKQLQGLTVNSIIFTKNNLTTDLIHDLTQLEVLAIHEVTEIPDGFFTNSQNLKNLRIDSMIQLNYFDSEAFSHLENLRNTTFLKNINLKNSPSRIFKKLKNLEHLYLDFNKFDYLPKDLLEIEDTKLKSFGLFGNLGKLSTLPSGFFKNCKKLELISIRMNYFMNLPEDLFFETESLIELYITDNKFIELPPKLFTNTKKLEKLHLCCNELETLPESLFENLRLKQLDLSKNNLMELPLKLFENATLEELDLRFNRLTKLSPALENPKLTRLYLGYNNLIYIDSKFCKKSTGLQDIDLSNNSLTIDDHVDNFWCKILYVKCKNLEFLNLRYNKINKLPYCGSNYNHPDTRKLHLDFGFNNITEIELYDILYGFPLNSTLTLSGPSLDTIYLRENLEKNEMIYQDIFQFFNDTELKIDLFDNQVLCDCKLIEFLNLTPNGQPYPTWYGKVTFHHINLKCKSPTKLQGHLVSELDKEDLFCELSKCPENCTCFDNPSAGVLKMNCSNKNLTNSDIYFLNLYNNEKNYTIKLDLSNNLLTETPDLNGNFSTYIVSLNLSKNRISKVKKYILTDNLQELNLDRNQITHLDNVILEKMNSRISNNFSLTLHNNPWICNCETFGLVQLLKNHSMNMKHLKETRCLYSNEEVFLQNHFQTCILFWLVLTVIISTCGTILGMLAAFYYKHNKKIKMWLYSKHWCMWFVHEDELDKDKKYDAFISFSHKDETFVLEEMVDRLEKGPNSYKLCLHNRDWLAGYWISDQILQSVQESRRTIIVVSRNFLESEWCRLELRTALSQAEEEKRVRVIVIVYGDIGNIDDLDVEMKRYLKNRTYIKWGDSHSWNQLIYALPHKLRKPICRKGNLEMTENQLEDVPLR